MGNFDVGAAEFLPTLTEEHHDGTSAVYGSDIQWISCRFYDHTNPIIAGPGSAWSLADAGAGLSNLKIRGCVAESWRGGGLNSTTVQGLKVLQTTFGNTPGSSTSPTAGDTITVNLASPGVSTTTKFTALAPPQPFLKQGNSGLLTAYTTAVNLLGAVCNGGVAVHMSGNTFGLVDQNPSAGVYVYTSSSTRALYLGSTATVRWAVKTGFDAVVAAGAAAERTLIVFGSESWKNGGSSDPKQFYRPDHFADAVNATIDALLAGATNNGGVQYWTHVSVWNEMKSRVANGLSTGWESDATLNPDTTTVVTTSNWLSNFAIAYTQFYNLLFDAIKAHANPIVNTVQVGGPHYAFGGVNPNPSNVFNATNDKNHRWPMGSPDGTTWPPWNWDYDCFVYWLKWSHGFDFISIDYSIVDNNDSVDANTAYIIAQRSNMGNLITKVKALRDTYAGMTSAANARADGLNASQVLALKRAAPIDHIEYYWDVNLSRCDTNYAEDVQAMQEALVVREMFLNGVRKAYKWMPEGQNDGTTLRNLNSWYRAEYTSNITSNSSSGLATNTGSGTKYLAYDVVKLFKDNFPPGTQLYNATCTNSNVVVGPATATKVLAINTSASSQSVTFWGSTVSLAPRSTTVLTGGGVAAGSTLSDVIIDTGTTSVTLRGVLARSQYYANTAVAETAIDKNLWREDWDRAGTNAKNGAVSFVSTTDLHLSTAAQDAGTGGPVPTDDADVLLWDTDGRGYGSNPAIGAYASPTVTSPVFSGAVSATALGLESQSVTALISGLAAGTTYHYRVSAIRTDGSGGVQVSSDMTFKTSGSAVITTTAAYGPASVVAPTSTVAGGTFVVKSDGLIYDSTGTTLQNMTSKTFTSLVTIKSDTAGTRRTLNAGLINNSRFGAGLVLTELIGNDPTSNFEVDTPSTTYGIDIQGCAGRFGHGRVISYVHNGIGLNASAAGVVCGATTSTWDTTKRNTSTNTTDFAGFLRIDNFTSHAGATADGAAVVAVKARNVILGGFDPGTQSSPTGLSAPAFLFDGAVADDVQDVVVGVALDGTTSIVGSKTGTYTFHLIDQRRSGWEGQLDKPVLFTNTTGSRPEKPVWLGVSGVSPGSETAVNTTNLLVTTDNPCLRNGTSQNLVAFTFKTGATASQVFEVDGTVWNTAASLTSWSDTTSRFVDGRDPLGARVSGSAAVIANKATLDSTFVVSGGAAGSAARAGDGWFEIRGVKFDPGQPSAQIWTGTTVFTTDNKSGNQLKVAASTSQAGGVMPTIPLWTGSAGGGVDLKVTNADGSTPAVFTGWPVPTTAIPVFGIRTNHADDLLGANAVETGVPYYRQLGYQGYDAANSKFTGVVLIPGPSGGAINPEDGEVLTVTAATPGVVTTFFPHGMATNDQVLIAGNTQAAANGTFKITRITPTTFSLQTTAGVNVAIPTPGTGGTFTPKGQGGVGYTYGLVGSRSTGFQMVAGETLDSTLNSNYGAPAHNASFFIGNDTTGIRLIGCDLFDVSTQAASTSAKIQIVDCTQTVTPLYGKGIDYDTVDNGVRGTYDPNTMPDPPRMIGGLNIIAPGEALWTIERYKVTNAVGDIAPGKFAIGSVMRHCKWHHGSDARNPQKNASTSRSGVTPGLLPQTDPGPHGDLYQNYDRNSITVLGCDLHTNAHSIWFSQIQFNYAVFPTQTFDNFGGHYRFTPGANHGFNVNDMVRITGTGDGVLDNKEWLVTQINTTSAKNDVVLGTTTYVANRAGTATHVIHLTLDMRRNDIRTSKHWDASDVTDSTHIHTKGNVSINQTNALIATVVTMVAKFLDNRIEQTDGANGSWNMATPLAGSAYDLGTPNRNVWRTYGFNNGAVPGGSASPRLT